MPYHWVLGKHLLSQLGNVTQSAVGDPDRSEAGGLQYTAQQLGSSQGTALIILTLALARSRDMGITEGQKLVQALLDVPSQVQQILDQNHM